MTWLMIAGGAPMVGIVIFGLVAIVAAARFAARPTPGRMPYIGALAAAVFFSIPAAMAADFVAVTRAVSENPEWQSAENFKVIVLAGAGESLAPAILGFAVLAVIALVSAVGLRRLGATA